MIFAKSIKYITFIYFGLCCHNNENLHLKKSLINKLL